MKICKSCQSTKLLVDFPSHSGMADGRLNKCKACIRLYSANYYQQNKERAKFLSSEWIKANPQRSADIRRAWGKANPEKAAMWQKNNPEKAAARSARWKAANPDQVQKANAKFRVINREKILVVSKRWKKLNPHLVTAYSRTYNQKYPDKVNARVAARKANKIQAMPSWANKFFIYEAYCLARLRTKMFGFSWHVDHIVPIQSEYVCGLHVEQNLQVIPAKENHLKGNRWWPGMSEFPSNNNESRLP